MNGIMIDLETLDVKPTALVLQLGYAIADMGEKKILSQGTLNLDGNEQKHRTIDFETVAWWMRQDRKVQDSVFSPMDLCCSVQYTREEISRLLEKWDIREVWAAPATFDLVILQDLWGEAPWDRRQQRDMTTLREGLDPDRKLMPADNIMHHNAEADAVWQMQYLFNLLEKMYGR